MTTMILSAGLAAGLMAASLQLPFTHHAAGAPAKAAPAHRQHFRPVSRWRVGRWLLTVHHERFTGAETCQVTRGRAHVERKALVLQLPPKVDTANAQYRIDAGRAFTVAEDRPALANQGFELWKDDLQNPSGAVVRVPLAKLPGAARIWVEAQRNGQVWAFPVAGLAEAMAAAKRESCPGV